MAPNRPHLEPGKAPFQKNRHFKPFPIVFSPPVEGNAYVTVQTKRTHSVKPGESFTIGMGQKADIKLPFHNKPGFQRDIHGIVRVNEKGQLMYHETSGDMGSALIRFKEPLRKRVLRDPSKMPGIAAIEHIKPGEERDITDGRSAIAFGVHPSTVKDGHLYPSIGKGLDGRDVAIIKDEFNHARPLLMVPLSGVRRYGEDGMQTLFNLAEDHVSNMQERLRKMHSLNRITSTSIDDYRGVVRNEQELRKLQLCINLLDGKKNLTEINELNGMFDLPEMGKG